MVFGLPAGVPHERLGLGEHDIHVVAVEELGVLETDAVSQKNERWLQEQLKL